MGILRFPSFPLVNVDTSDPKVAVQQLTKIVQDLYALLSGEVPGIGSGTAPGSVHWGTLPYLSVSGGTLQGALDMGGFRITDLGDPVNPMDAVNLRSIGSKFEAANMSGWLLRAGMLVEANSQADGICAWNGSATSELWGNAYGLLAKDTAEGDTGTIQSAGLFTLSDWTLVTGTSALMVGAMYWGDTVNPGMLTRSVPAGGSGKLALSVGVAVLAQSLMMCFGPVVKV